MYIGYICRDTAGQERFQATAQACYRGASVSKQMYRAIGDISSQYFDRQLNMYALRRVKKYQGSLAYVKK